MPNTNTPESIELYLFAICPFAQRVHISLIQSGLAFDKVILDPGNMPDDFNTISPLGNVPVLRINNSEVVFESSVINDYIARISPVKMEPETEIKCAQMRAWSEYNNECMGAMMQVLSAENEAAFKQANKALIDKLQVLDNQIEKQGMFFYGDTFTTIDSTYAPLFLRMKTLQDMYGEFSLQGLPDSIEKWMQTLLNNEAVNKSIIGDFPKIYRMFISKRAGGNFIDQQLQ